MLIGWWHGAGALGFYARAYHLLLLPMQQLVQPLSNVAVPALSRLQATPERYRNYYRKALLPLVAVAFPLVVFSAVEAHNVVSVMLGENWSAAAPIFQLLAPASLIGSFYVATGWVYVSLGRADRQLRWGAISSVITVIGFAVSLPWGPEAVAASFSVVTVALRYPSVVYCFRGSPLTLRDLWEPLWRPAVATTTAGITAWATRGALEGHAPLAALLMNGAVFGVAYLATWIVLPKGWQTIREMAHLAEEFRPRRVGAATTTTAAAAAAAAVGV
jgi:PST family polysaccharide transporter